MDEGRFEPTMTGILYPGDDGVELEVIPEHHWVELTEDEVGQVPDLTWHLDDLLTARRLFDVVLGYLSLGGDRPDEAKWVYEGVYRAAVVSYARAFASSRSRTRYAEEYVLTLSPGAREAHQRLLDLRNMHIAHSDSTFEEARVFVSIRDDGQPGPILARAVTVNRGLDTANVAAYRDLAEHALRHFGALLQAQQADVSTRLGTDGLASLAGRPAVRTVRAGPVELRNRPRERLAQARPVDKRGT